MGIQNNLDQKSITKDLWANDYTDFTVLGPRAKELFKTIKFYFIKIMHVKL
jgi:hypothetical protein